MISQRVSDDKFQGWRLNRGGTFDDLRPFCDDWGRFWGTRGGCETFCDVTK